MAGSSAGEEEAGYEVEKVVDKRVVGLSFPEISRFVMFVLSCR